MSITVIAPEAIQSSSFDFSDKIPPLFHWYTDYAAYREEVTLWTNLKSLPANKHGPVIIGRLHEESNTAAKTICANDICEGNGVEHSLGRLDKAYEFDQTNQLGNDLTYLVDYTWRK